MAGFVDFLRMVLHWPSSGAAADTTVSPVDRETVWTVRRRSTLATVQARETLATAKQREILGSAR